MERESRINQKGLINAHIPQAHDNEARFLSSSPLNGRKLLKSTLVIFNHMSDEQPQSKMQFMYAAFGLQKGKS